MIPLQTGAQGAGDGHRPNAKEKSSGDKALAQGVPAILSAAFEAPVHAVAKALDRPVNVQGNPGDAAQHDGEDDSHAVHFSIQPQYANDYHAQAQCLHQSIRIFLGQAAPQQQAQTASRDDSQGIDKYAEHRIPPPVWAVILNH
ncbi:hypothetical protein SDC9_141515 [bioreactor metagenome]|uniref:Uncharacterized protein n=1 Tax=bioreactor metagenome TaxID=1076179 RepID=A0A645DYM1_9ZZZZ